MTKLEIQASYRKKLKIGIYILYFSLLFIYIAWRQGQEKGGVLGRVLIGSRVSQTGRKQANRASWAAHPRLVVDPPQVVSAKSIIILLRAAPGEGS